MINLLLWLGSLQRFSRLKFGFQRRLPAVWTFGSNLTPPTSFLCLYWIACTHLHKLITSQWCFVFIYVQSWVSKPCKASFSRILKFIWWFSWSWINLELSVCFWELEECLDVEMVKCCRLDQLIVACRAPSAHLHAHPKRWMYNWCLLVFYTDMDNIY